MWCFTPHHSRWRRNPGSAGGWRSVPDWQLLPVSKQRPAVLLTQSRPNARPRPCGSTAKPPRESARLVDFADHCLPAGQLRAGICPWFGVSGDVPCCAAETDDKVRYASTLAQAPLNAADRRQQCPCSFATLVGVSLAYSVSRRPRRTELLKGSPHGRSHSSCSDAAQPSAHWEL